jgi:ribonuclease D
VGDVEHLHLLRSRLKATLQDLGRTTWFDEEMDSFVGGEMADDFDVGDCDDMDRWKHVRRAWKLADSPEKLRSLQRLAAWRERQAREVQLAPMLVARDDLLLSLATSQPTTLEELKGFSGLKPFTLRFNGHALLNCLQPQRAVGHSSAVDGSGECAIEPAATLVPPTEWSFSKRKALEVQVIHGLLETCVLATALRLGLNASLLASRKTLQAFIVADAAEEELSPLLCGWRRDVIGLKLAALKHGRSQLLWSEADGGLDVVVDGTSARSIKLDK